LLRFARNDEIGQALNFSSLIASLFITWPPTRLVA
jgi:hypothetical protein